MTVFVRYTAPLSMVAETVLMFSPVTLNRQPEKNPLSGSSAPLPQSNTILLSFG